jgi:hypothetical protein
LHDTIKFFKIKLNLNLNFNFRNQILFKLKLKFKFSKHQFFVQIQAILILNQLKYILRAQQYNCNIAQQYNSDISRAQQINYTCK